MLTGFAPSSTRVKTNPPVTVPGATGLRKPIDRKNRSAALRFSFDLERS
jgi:hypothetical protein